MSRVISVGGAQVGGITTTDNREVVVERWMALLRDASAQGCDLVVFQVLALTSLFPRSYGLAGRLAA